VDHSTWELSAISPQKTGHMDRLWTPEVGHAPPVADAGGGRTTTMTTTTSTITANLLHMKSCRRCGVRYDWRRSPSSWLKMTYCGSFCEKADMGFTIETLLGPVERARVEHCEKLAA
jgi:hypothetical protein